MADMNYDLIVIGGGPGGYVAAIRAAQLGLSTAVVERENLGGICLNWGCIPTKALLRSAEVLRNAKHAAEYGLVIQNPSFDLDKVVQRSRKVAGQLNGGVKHLLKKNKVAVIEGEAKLLGKGQVAVTKGGAAVGTFGAKNIIIATGARARTLPGLEDDGNLVWTYRKAMTPNTTPKSLLVIGSGAIGIEFASFYNELGAKVTVVEVMDRILPVEDEEISAFARKQFEKQGMRIITNGKAGNLRKGADSVTVAVEANGKTEDITVDRVILAVGIAPNTENLGLENTKVQTDRGHIKTNANCQTDEPGVYAIGDVTGAPWLAHKASHEGVIAVEHIAGKHPHALDVRNIPGCTYSHPQIASVGLTEKKAKEAGYEVRVGRFPFIGNGKAIALGEADGMVKTVFDAKTGELLGAHMVGAEVTELIQGYTVAKTMETTEQELMQTVFPHPTLSEMMHESVLDAYGRAIHF
ncbi:dihydrolipoyl dehydrogenase [Azospirillum brasilense]|uniref:Dihydrolipoyl dehydrogenase n=2 Tax=Azospirillum TaxID=191 RepID=A0A0P0EHB3_AZOBR|nr:MULTISPECIES: dihydrolipoyl dehydrogenase [Azospirillum]ALJ37301.1 dihydrolipoamide dehydrogenase [Azospirillum brasilense]KAA1054825.1 Dihydrolipoamide dehydrogenase of pyruvate dehydrogenase complex [Azospirillum argentinense]MDW7552026.1 dihydrolipoyl dehydrogenase [Azospirillum brasilense]MDW7591461.1 dihydrolipoyl dehydrogenase [Azospirillum brasilense]MDW7626631.1 dihydrolipoyl dehydrogenase [Azospirillum brasilense]